jgi:hypothetical protein
LNEAFSVSVSQLERIIRYLKKQTERHRTTPCQKGDAALLQQSEISDNERYLWV